MTTCWYALSPALRDCRVIWPFPPFPPPQGGPRDVVQSLGASRMTKLLGYPCLARSNLARAEGEPGTAPTRVGPVVVPVLSSLTLCAPPHQHQKCMCSLLLTLRPDPTPDARSETVRWRWRQGRKRLLQSPPRLVSLSLRSLTHSQSYHGRLHLPFCAPRRHHRHHGQPGQQRRSCPPRLVQALPHRRTHS